MAVEDSSNQPQYTFRAAKLSGMDLLVASMEGNEAISRLFSYRLVLASKNHDFKSEDLVGQEGSITILMNHADGSGVPSDPDVARFVNGVVSRFDHLMDGTTYTLYEAELVPFAWLLTLRRTSRIFQQMNVKDIITKVLTDAGLTTEMFQFALSGTYPKREYCVQYRESEWDFVQRLMEEEGIFYFFEHKEEAHVLKMGDTPEVHVPIVGASSKLPYRPESGMVLTEHVSAFRLGQSIRTGKITGRDFEFTKPVPAIQDLAKAALNPELEVYDYPFQYNSEDKKEQTNTTRLAKIRLQEQQTYRIAARGKALCRRFITGSTFELIDHPRTATNQVYLLSSMRVEGVQPEVLSEDLDFARARFQGPNFVNEVTVIPITVPFRPPRITSRPFVHGAQTAIVVGPSSEEIYTDKYARVKVRFHWDREGEFTEKDSMWVRVDYGWCGGMYGHMFIPRIGQEVIVSFLEGNPDEPIITGMVYNGDQMPPCPLPDEKTKSYVFRSNSSIGGGGANELSIDDKKGSEKIFLHAEKDMHVRVKHNEIRNVEYCLHETVTKDEREEIGGSMSTAIGGAHAISVGGNRNIKVKENVLEDYGGDQVREIGGDLDINVAGKTVLTSGGRITLKGPGGFICIGDSGIEINGSMVWIVGGTVLINSGAGPGCGEHVADPAASPAAPQDADKEKPGKDVDYTGKKEPPVPIKPPEIATKEWIAFTMKDTEGNVKAGEPFKIVTSDGRELEGTLDVNGEARIRGIEPGTCEIIFTRRDQTEVKQA